MKHHKMDDMNFLRSVLEEALAALWAIAAMVALHFGYHLAALAALYILSFVLVLGGLSPVVGAFISGLRFAWKSDKEEKANRSSRD